MLNRRSFITIAAASLGTAGIGLASTSAAPANAQTTAGTPQIQIGPVAVWPNWTILRVAASTYDDFDFFVSTGAFSMSSRGPVPSGIRLLSVDRGLVLRPLDSPPWVRSKAGTNLPEAYAVFDAIEGPGPVEVRIPGYTIVSGVPIVPTDQAPFAIASS